MHTSFKNKYIWTARFSKCSVTAALLSMLVRKTKLFLGSGCQMEQENRWHRAFYRLLQNKNLPRTVFRCLSPFKIGIHISLEQSVWADLSWNPFQKRIASICFGPNHSGKKFGGKIWIFEKVIFNFSAEIGFFGLTWRVTLL